MINLKSLFRLIDIEILRNWDQFKRSYTGLPVLKTSQITDKLFVGGQYKTKLTHRIQALGITAIVNMRTRPIHLKEQSKGLKYLYLPTPNWHAPTMENLKKGVKFIQKEIDQGGKVYIHCKAGEGRGPTMAIAYLISTGLSFEDAYEMVRKVRRFIRPTRSQIEQLKKFEANYA